MKTKKYLRVLALTLAIVVFCSGIGAAAYAQGVKSGTEVKSDEGEPIIKKDETVYVLTSADGTVNKIIVSDWIKNGTGASEIEDMTELSDIQDVKNEQSYTIGAENMRVWNADGGDIYYQGTTTKALPVDVSVSYSLNGQNISADELAGKSGKVSMRFDYTNNEYENVTVDGKSEKIYVPFAMLTGTILDNDNFSNVEVTNGKVINDGNRTIVIGLALPGMQENLNVDGEKLEIPDYVEITADVADFQLTTTMTFAANDFFSGIDLDELDTLDSVSSSMDKLTDAMSQLIDGSSALYNGISTLLDKSSELVTGIDTLALGANALASGADQLSSGAHELKNGADKLYSGLDSLSSNSQSLQDGARQIFDTLLSTANAQLAAAGINAETLTMDNFATVLDGILASLDEDAVYSMAYNTAYNTVSNAVRGQEASIRLGVESAVRETVMASVLESMGLTPESLAALPLEQQQEIQDTINSQMASDEALSLIDSNTEQQIQFIIDQNMASESVQAQINSAVENANAGFSSIAALKTQLESYNEFYQGILSYTGGVSALYEGAWQLSSGVGNLASGADELSRGANELAGGVNTLKGGGSTMVDGISQLKDGAMQLTDGLKQLDEEGIQALIDAAGGLDILSSRLKATVDVSNNYSSFSGISDGMDGEVKFIYETESIGKNN